MINIDPQQEIFTKLLMKLRTKSYSVFDGYLPPDNTPYPFIYLADSRQDDEANKTAVFGVVTQNIHVYGLSPEQRGTVSKILLDVKTLARNIEQTTNFTWLLQEVHQQVIPDNTTTEPLLHGILELKFKFS